MFKKDKYYGEIWCKDDEKHKSFCLLEIIEDKVILTSNLSNSVTEFRKDIIHGAFNGLGYMTFVDCLIQANASGVSEYSIYNPRYAFHCSSHFINPANLLIKEFTVDNSAIVHWIRKFHFYNYAQDKLEKRPNTERKIDISDSLSLTIKKNTSHSQNVDSFQLNNEASIYFNSSQNLILSDGIELYNSFQKLLLFLYGKTHQFNSFSFKCLGCDEWVSLYFKNDLTLNSISNFINFSFDDLKEELDTIVKNWFNDDRIRFCADVIIENLLSVKISHSRRFTNSYSAFEAFCQTFSVEKKSLTVEKHLLSHSELISQITCIEKPNIKPYLKNIIRNRKFLIHRTDIRDSRFSELELLYISFLLDFIVGISLLKEMSVSKMNINNSINKAKRIYNNIQNLNKRISRDSIK